MLVQYALKYAPKDVEYTRQRRLAVASLATACATENEELLVMCEHTVAAVLRALGVKNVALMRGLAAKRPGCSEHVRLRGRAPNGMDMTKLACPYWPAWARSVAERWTPTLLVHERKIGWEASTPMMITATDSSPADALVGSNYVPGGAEDPLRSQRTR